MYLITITTNTHLTTNKTILWVLVCRVSDSLIPPSNTHLTTNNYTYLCLVGIGLSFGLVCLRQYPLPFNLVMDMSAMVSIIFLYLALGSTLFLVAIPCQFQLRPGSNDTLIVILTPPYHHMYPTVTPLSLSLSLSLFNTTLSVCVYNITCQVVMTPLSSY